MHKNGVKIEDLAAQYAEYSDQCVLNDKIPYNIINFWDKVLGFNREDFISTKSECQILRSWGFKLKWVRDGGDSDPHFIRFDNKFKLKCWLAANGKT